MIAITHVHVQKSPISTGSNRITCMRELLNLKCDK